MSEIQIAIRVFPEVENYTFHNDVLISKKEGPFLSTGGV